MSNPKTLLFCILFVSAAAGNANAACGSAWPNRTQVLEIRIYGCQSAAAFSAEAAERVDAKWLLRMQENAVKGTEGWVIRGTAVQTQELSTYEDGTRLLGSPLQADVQGRWFIPTSANDPAPFSCPSAPGQVLRFLVSSPCCDTLPPSDFSCWFEFKNLVRVSEKLDAKLGYR